MSITAFEANPFQRKAISTEEAAELFGTWDQRIQMEQIDVQKTAAGNEGALGGTMGAGIGFGLGNQMAGQMNPQMAQQQMMQQQMMMQQMQQMQEMMNNMQGGNAPAQQSSQPTLPQTPEEIQNFLDMLDMRFASGEIKEETYQNMKSKWEGKLNELSGD